MQQLTFCGSLHTNAADGCLSAFWIVRNMSSPCSIVRAKKQMREVKLVALFITTYIQPDLFDFMRGKEHEINLLACFTRRKSETRKMSGFEKL